VKGKFINSKHFIILPDLGRDVVLEKNVMQSIINLPEAGESYIIVKLEKEPEPFDHVIVVDVDDSSSNEISDGDEEARMLRVILFLILMACQMIKVNI
jgi:hypothetical protein